MPTELPDSAVVSRFLFDSRNIVKTPITRVKGRAFLPEKYLDQWETSICDLAPLTDTQVWQRGNSCRPNKQLVGRVDIQVLAVRLALDVGLRCVLAPMTNFDEHAVIVGWPDEKEEQLALANELAVRCGDLLLPP